MSWGTRGLRPLAAAVACLLVPGLVVAATVTGAVASTADDDTQVTVTRLAGDSRVSTSLRIAQHVFPSTAPTVYVARSDVFADALTAGSLTDGPVVLVPSCGLLPASVKDAVERWSPDRIVALGGVGAVCDDVLSELASPVNATTSRLAGADRYETASEIAAHAFPAGAPVVYVGSGSGAPDPISAGVIVDGPILLGDPHDRARDVLSAAIAGLDAAEAVAIGGIAALPDEALVDVAVPASRLAGGNRFQTAAEVSRREFGPGSLRGRTAGTVYLARGDVYADAVSGGQLTDGPILLVPQCGELPHVVRAELWRLQPSRVAALGGPSAVCDDLLHMAAREARPVEPTLAPGVRQLDGADALRVDRAAGVVEFATSSEVNGLQAGDVIFVPAERMPDGVALAAAVEDINVIGNTTRVVGHAPPLEEFVGDGYVQGFISGAAASFGGTFSEQSDSRYCLLCQQNNIALEFNGLRIEGTMDTEIAFSEVAFKPDADYYSATLSTSIALNADVSGSLSASGRKSVFRTTVKAVPTPATFYTVGVYAEVLAEAEVTATGGFKYGFSTATTQDGSVTVARHSGDPSVSVALTTNAASSVQQLAYAEVFGTVTPTIELDFVLTAGAFGVGLGRVVGAGFEVGFDVPATLAGVLSECPSTPTLTDRRMELRLSSDVRANLITSLLTHETTHGPTLSSRLWDGLLWRHPRDPPAGCDIGCPLGNDRCALNAFYASMNGPNWVKNDGWGSTKDVCDWVAVHCNPEGRVVKLGFGGNNLRGSLPGEMAAMTQLREIFLQQVELASIHPNFGFLNSLRKLNLQVISGPLHMPPELKNLANLQSLHLFNTQLTAIPAFVFELPNLEELHFAAHHNLDSEIPSAELRKLHRLRILDLYKNGYRDIPREVGYLPNLQQLYVSYNWLTGDISHWADGLAANRIAIHLDIGDNPKSGQFNDCLTVQEPATAQYLTSLDPEWNQCGGA